MQPPDVLITTLESLDSLLCRRRSLFSTCSAAIVDEIHLVDRTYRGDQLRVLLDRARRASDRKLATHLLSATLSSPAETAARYGDDFHVIDVPGRRDIEHYGFSSYRELRDRARAWKKILCFCNTREAVETTAHELASLWRPYPVVAHHGRLSRQEREAAECVMREHRVAVCVATSTLEVGIDIGDVDVVALHDVPWSVAAFLQRVGRGNRKRTFARVAVRCTCEEEERAFEAMLQLAQEGALDDSPYAPDLSVAAQQVLSLLFGEPHHVAELQRLLSRLASPSTVTATLSRLADLGYVAIHGQQCFATTYLKDLGERGSIHSNIPSPQDRQVIDVTTDRPVGRISGAFDRVFILGRRGWEIVSVERDRAYVRPVASASLPAQFQRSRSVGAFSHLLPPMAGNN